MAYDAIKPTGSRKASRPEAGGANTRTVPMLAVVKDNVDPIRAGRLQVYIADFGGKDSNDANSWVTVSYMSPFFGSTPASGAKDDHGSYTKNPSSYGMWTSPPDIGSTVICIFINGDPNYGFYIGCVPQPETLYSVPCAAGFTNVVMNDTEANSYGGASRLPVSNLNTNNHSIADSANFLNEARPVNSYEAAVLMQQGLIRDSVRGVIGSSAQRESPSRVGYGINTPGRPITEGGFTDDNITNSLGATPDKLKVVARRGGHSFVMDDGDVLGRDQLIRMRTATGHQILMSDDGQCLFIIHANGQSWIELGKEGTIDMYASNSVNIRTQGDLNLHADNNININAAKTLNIAAETINTNSEKETTMKVGTDFRQYTSGKYTIKVTGGMSMAADGEASYASSSTTYINGSKVNLNSGSTSVVPGEVKPIPIIKHTDTLYDASKGFAAAPGKLSSIVSRAPAHAPWVSAGQGVDVKTEMGAAASLPSPPSAAATAANDAAAAAGPINPVSPAVAATVPSTDAVSSAIDKNAGGTMVAQAATMAATGPAKEAAALGAGVVGTGAAAVAAIGICAAGVKQLEGAGLIKPGSAALAASLVSGGKSVKEALTSNLFTGKAGAENLSLLVKNTTAQANMQITNMQAAQTGLAAAGLLTGKESPTQIGGMVLAGATNGVAAVTKLVTNPGSTVATSALGSTAKAMASGNFAAGMAATVTGGMSSISGALGSAMNSAKGVVGSAFAAVTAGFKKMEAGVPQNLKALASGSGADALAASSKAGVSGLSSAVAAAAAGAASGVNSIPGGVKAVSSLVNSAKGAIDSVPGIGAAGKLASQIPSGQSIGGLVAAAKVAALAGLTTAAAKAAATAQLTSAISGQGGGGASPEKIATVAINTLQTRAGMDSVLKGALGDKVPAPVYTGNPASYGATAGTAKVDKIGGLKDDYATAAAEFDVASAAAETARSDALDAVNNLPQGDPGIAAAKEKWTAAIAAKAAASSKVLAALSKVKSA